MKRLLTNIGTYVGINVQPSLCLIGNKRQIVDCSVDFSPIDARGRLGICTSKKLSIL